LSDNEGMRLITLILISAILSACAKNESSSTTVVTSLSCDSLNAKYVSYTKDQLLSQSIEYSSAAASAQGDYYVNLYNGKSIELLKASECK